jgi:hypothetical protein
VSAGPSGAIPYWPPIPPPSLFSANLEQDYSLALLDNPTQLDPPSPALRTLPTYTSLLPPNQPSTAVGSEGTSSERCLQCIEVLERQKGEQFKIYVGMR